MSNEEVSSNVHVPIGRRVYDAGERILAPQRTADGRRPAAAVALGRRRRRLRAHAVAASRGVLRRHPSDHRPPGRRAGSPPGGISADHRQANEDPLMEDTHVHALDYLSVFYRRKWWLIVPIALSIVVGAALVRFLPKEFRSTHDARGSRAGVSPSLVSQSAPFDNEERLRAITQQLMTAAMLLDRVAREEGLDLRTPTTRSSHACAARHRRSPCPDPVATTNEPRRLDAFIVSYTDADPARAQRVANRLAHVFVDENSKTREPPRRRTRRRSSQRSCSASQQRLADARSQAAAREGIAHGPAAGADAGEPADARRTAAAARHERVVAARRAGSPVAARAPDRRR